MRKNLFKLSQNNQVGFIVTIEELQQINNIDDATFKSTFGNLSIKYIIGPILGIPSHNLNQHSLWQNISDVGLYVRKDANNFELLPTSLIPQEVAAQLGVPQRVIEYTVQHTMPLESPGYTYPQVQQNNKAEEAILPNNNTNTDNAPQERASEPTTPQAQLIKKQYCPDLFDYNESTGVSTLKNNVKQLLEASWVNAISKQPNYASDDPVKIVKTAYPNSIKMQKLLFLASTCKAGIFSKDQQYNAYIEKDKRYINKPSVQNSVFENDPAQCATFHQFMYRLQLKLKSIQGGSIGNWKNWESSPNIQGPVKP